jgi:hypothetical protein
MDTLLLYIVLHNDNGRQLFIKCNRLNGYYYQWCYQWPYTYDFLRFSVIHLFF